MSQGPLEDLFATVPRELMSETQAEDCVSCGSSGLMGFFELGDIPAQSTLLVDSREAAKALGGASLLLALCPVCGLIQNTRFAPEMVDYSLPSEESQAFSGVFGEYARALADDLVSTYDLVGRTVLEVGSGKGDFLEVLARAGIGSAVGIDPGYLPQRGPDVGNVEFRREWYGSGNTHETADLILARHLLEHVPNVGEFLGWLAKSTSHTPDGVLFVEVPDTTRVLAEGAFWDVYHEHCTYFTPSSLDYAMRRAGMEVTRLESAFDGQYLHAAAHAGTTSSPQRDGEAIRAIAQQAVEFADSADKAVDGWRRRIGAVIETGREVALWGASSKAVAFIAATGSSPHVVDINPHKQGKWLPGVAVEVLRPEALTDVDPALVIPMNPIYLDEITADLSSMGLAPTVQPVDDLSR